MTPPFDASTHPIPPIIHFIWVGPKPIPDFALDNIIAWADNLFWRRSKADDPRPLSWDARTGYALVHTDSREAETQIRNALARRVLEKAGPQQEHDPNSNPLASISVATTDPINRRLYDNIGRYVEPHAVWAARSDILRLEILARYGGVYMDLDLIPLPSPQETLPHLLTGVSLAFADERNQADKLDLPMACNGNYFIAAKPNHPALWTAVRELESNVVLNKGRVLVATGPHYVFRHLTRHSDCVLFPWQLFNPCKPRHDWKKVTQWPPHAVANHCFEGTWYDQTKTEPNLDE